MEDLLNVPLSSYHRVQVNDQEILCYRAKKEVWGKTRTIVVFLSEKPRQGQLQGLKQAIGKCRDFAGFFRFSPFIKHPPYPILRLDQYSSMYFFTILIYISYSYGTIGIVFYNGFTQRSVDIGSQFNVGHLFWVRPPGLMSPQLPAEIFRLQVATGNPPPVCCFGQSKESRVIEITNPWFFSYRFRVLMNDFEV